MLLLFAWLAWTVRQDLEILARMACPVCNRPFGREAAMAAKHVFLREAAERREKNPGIRFRIVGKWPIQCPECGFKGQYHVQDRRLIPGGNAV